MAYWQQHCPYNDWTQEPANLAAEHTCYSCHHLVAKQIIITFTTPLLQKPAAHDLATHRHHIIHQHPEHVAVVHSAPCDHQHVLEQLLLLFLCSIIIIIPKDIMLAGWGFLFALYALRRRTKGHKSRSGGVKGTWNTNYLQQHSLSCCYCSNRMNIISRGMCCIVIFYWLQPTLLLLLLLLFLLLFWYYILPSSVSSDALFCCVTRWG